MIFNGLHQILMHVIEETVHNDDMGRDGKPLKSKEERFDDTMHAILGDQYERRFKQTSDFFASELGAIKRIEARGKSFRAAVADVAKHRLPEVEEGNEADKREYEKELTRLEDQVKKHFKRQYQHYKEFVPMDNNKDLERSFGFDDELLNEAKEQRKNIFKALRAAGWDIY
jgi:hypothetical protein